MKIVTLEKRGFDLILAAKEGPLRSSKLEVCMRSVVTSCHPNFNSTQQAQMKRRCIHELQDDVSNANFCV
jgi:hypothetical protein